PPAPPAARRSRSGTPAASPPRPARPGISPCPPRPAAASRARRAPARTHRRRACPTTTAARSAASSRAASGETMHRLEVALARPRHHLGRERGRGRLVVPARVVEPVAHELLVEREQAPGLVLGAVPVAR